MILISIKSEIMDCERQFEKDLHVEKFLKRVNKIHSLARLERHKKPKNTGFIKHILIRRWESEISKSIPLKITIINTN